MKQPNDEKTFTPITSANLPYGSTDIPLSRLLGKPPKPRIEGHKRVTVAQEPTTLKQFKTALKALLETPGISGRALINCYRGFLEDDGWLYNLPEKDYEWFITFWDDIDMTIRANRKADNERSE